MSTKKPIADPLTPTETRIACDLIRITVEQVKSAGDSLHDGLRTKAAERLDAALEAIRTLRKSFAPSVPPLPTFVAAALISLLGFGCTTTPPKPPERTPEQKVAWAAYHQESNRIMEVYWQEELAASDAFDVRVESLRKRKADLYDLRNAGELTLDQKKELAILKLDIQHEHDLLRDQIREVERRRAQALAAIPKPATP